MNPQRITVVRHLAAPVADVYRAWTDPPTMSRWFGEKVDAEVRIGGTYRVETDAGDGATHVHTGEYLVLEPAARIVQTFGAEPLVDAFSQRAANANEYLEVTFAPVGPNGTELTLSHGWDGTDIDAEYEDALRQGWEQWLDLLQQALS